MRRLFTSDDQGDGTVRNATRLGSMLSVLAVAVAVGCQGEKPAPAKGSDTSAADAGRPQTVLDPKLGAAVAAAAASGGPAPSGAGAVPGVPQTGVYEKGVADTTHARGAPAKVEVVSTGAEPRERLSFARDAAEQKARMTVGVRQGQSAMPAVEFALVLKLDKPKPRGDGDGVEAKPKKGAEESTKTAAAEPGPGPTLLAKITSAGIEKSQAGGVPKELSEAFAKLKGSQARFSVAPNGALGDATLELAKGAPSELEVPLRSLVDALAMVTPAFPDEPVGAGAQWIVTDRAGSFGIDVLRYRAFRLEKGDGGRPKLAVDVRQFAADASRVELAGARPGLNPSIEGFQSQGKGALLLSPNRVAPVQADIDLRIQALLRAGGQQRMQLQVDLTGALTSDDAEGGDKPDKGRKTAAP